MITRPSLAIKNEVEHQDLLVANIKSITNIRGEKLRDGASVTVTILLHVFENVIRQERLRFVFDGGIVMSSEGLTRILRGINSFCTRNKFKGCLVFQGKLCVLSDLLEK